MTTEGLHHQKENDELSLKELFLKIRELYKYLLSKWIFIIIFAIIGGVLGAIYGYFKSPVYTATSTFVLEDGEKGGGLGGLGGLASMAGIDIGGGGGLFQGDNIIELYKSRTMIEKTLLSEVMYNGKKQLLIDSYIDFKRLREKWNKDPKLKNLHFSVNDRIQSRLKDSVLGKTVQDVTKYYLSVMKLDKQSGIIKVNVNAENEFFAKTFNDLIVKNVNDFYILTKTKKSLQNVRIIEHKTDSVRAVMNGEIYRAAAISDATPNLNPTRQVQRAAPMQRSQFSAETNKAILAELVKNLEMSKISYNKETPLIQIIDMPIYPLQKEKLGLVKGFLLGSILCGFISVVVLLIKQFIKNILTGE